MLEQVFEFVGKAIIIASVVTMLAIAVFVAVDNLIIGFRGMRDDARAYKAIKAQRK